MGEPRRFYVVCQAGVADPPSRSFDDRETADQAARVMAVQNLGETFVVLEPVEAYRSSEPHAQKVYLSWPAQAAVAEAPPPPADQGVSF